MAEDLATLGLRLTNEQAIADAKATGAAYEDMGVKGEAAQKKLAASSSPVEAAIRRQTDTAQFLATKQAEAIAINDRLGTSQQRIAQYTAQAAAEQRKMTLLQIEAIAINEKQAVTTVASTHGLSAWSALQAEATGHVGEHNLAVGRLERALASIVGHFLGANAAVELLGSGLLKFAIGGIETAAILGGIALIIAIYEHFTSATREAEKAQDDLLKKMREVEATKLAGGVEGQTATAAQTRVDAAVRALEVLQKVSATVDKPGQLSGGFLGNVGGRTKEQQAVIDEAVKDLAIAMANRDEVYTKGAETQDRAFRSDLASLITHNHATAAERANALTLLRADQAALTKLPSSDVAARAGLSSEIEKLQSALFPKKETADALRDAKEYAKAMEQAVAETNKLNLEQAKKTIGIETDRANADLLLAAAKLGTTEYNNQVDAIAVQNKLAQDGIYWFDARYDAAKKSLEVTMAERRETEMILKTREQDASAAKAAAQKAAEEAQRPFRNMIRQLQGEFATFFDNIFTKGIRSFGDLVSAIKDMFLKMIAEILAASLMKRLAGVLGAMIGAPAVAGAQTAGAGSGGMLSGLGSQIAGQAALGGLAGGAVGYGVGQLAGNAALGGLGGAAAGAGVGFMLGGPIGALAGGVTGLVGGLLGGASAAREAAAAMRQLQKDYNAALMTFKHDSLGTALAQNAAEAEALRAQAQKLYGTFAAIWKDMVNGVAPGSTLKNANADIAAQEAKNAATIARQAQYAQEDLVVRNLRATGQGSAADLQAFQNQQAREMQAALDANRDATYLSYLATVQNNELIAFQNGLLSTAMRNAPSGFYGIEAYLGQYATPRGPAGYPTDGGANPLGPNPTGGLTPPGGTGSPPPNRFTLVFQPGALVMDKNGVMNVVLEKIDQSASANDGAGSSRSQALDKMSRR